MDDLKKDVSEIKECQIRMEVDLKHHIKRTDTLEKMTLPIYKAFIFLKYLAIAVPVIAGLLLTFSRLAKADELHNVLEYLQESTQCEIIITSSERNIAKNAIVGGSPTSYHVLGRAIDFTIKCRKTTLTDIMRRIPLHISALQYKSHIHIDDREFPIRGLRPNAE